MNKKKIRTIIISIIIAVLGAIYSVFYILNPGATQKTTKDVLEFVCEKPLPVFGLTILGAVIAIRNIISVTGIGKKALNECKQDLAASRQAQKEYREDNDKFKAQMEERYTEFINQHISEMRQICSLIPNKNVKELGEKLYGREEDNNEEIEE